MSYSPSEAARDAQEHVEFLKLLAETYPGAWQTPSDEHHGKLWVSSDLTRADCDTALLTQSSFLGKPSPVIWYGKKLGKGTVFTHPSDAVNLWTASTSLLMRIGEMIKEEERARRGGSSAFSANAPAP